MCALSSHVAEKGMFIPPAAQPHQAGFNSWGFDSLLNSLIVLVL